MSVIANTLIGIAKSWADARGAAECVEIGENGFTYRIVKPAKDDEHDWSEQVYDNGNIYWAEHADPKIIECEETDQLDANNPETANAISTGRYETWMKQDLVQRMFSGEKTDIDLETYLLGAILVVMLMGIFLYFGG